MSRLGKSSIKLPKGVEVKVENNVVVVKGPKGHLEQQLMEGIKLSINEGILDVSIDEKIHSNGKFHGLYRSLINNMVIGVSVGFEKKLTLIGVGYRAAIKGKKLDLQVGYSHPTELDIPEGIEVKVDKSTTIVLHGVDKQNIGQFAAKIRSTRPPEPYKGKGIRYENEYVRKKAGKSAKAK